MPGQFQWSVDTLAREVDGLAELGIGGVMLFGIPHSKDAEGSENWDTHGIVPQAIRAIKDEVPEMIIISDMCLCEYTEHGHCGVINTPLTSSYRPQLADGYLLDDPTYIAGAGGQAGTGQNVALL